MQCASQINAHKFRYPRLEKNMSTTHLITWKQKLIDDVLNPHVHRPLAYMLMGKAIPGYKRAPPPLLSTPRPRWTKPIKRPQPRNGFAPALLQAGRLEQSGNLFGLIYNVGFYCALGRLKPLFSLKVLST